LPSYGISRTSAGGKAGTESGGKRQALGNKQGTESGVSKPVDPQPVPTNTTTTPKPVTIPMIKPNKEKVNEAIRDAFDIIASDIDYGCLQDEYKPENLFPAPPMSLTIIKDRVDSESYEDHFQFMDDLITTCTYWIQGPPQPNPMLPQYMAALKLLRNGTDILMSSLIGKISNDDYYTGPDVDEAIKEEIRYENETIKSRTSPSFARKVKRPSEGVTASKQKTSSGQTVEQLKSIEQQVTMLTQHVLGLHKATPRQSTTSAGTDGRPLTQDEIRKLESDLMTLSPEDIDHIVSNILKDEPSVRIDDESYELDVAALPPVKQRNLRRFVTRKLNMRDPAHGTHKLKQLLKDDDLARASEEMAERLLAASSMPSPAMASGPLMMGLPAIAGVATSSETPQMNPEEAEAERQRIEREKKREEEAKRLWRLAHGDDDDDDNSMDMD
jgi:hypothetical protein